MTEKQKIYWQSMKGKRSNRFNGGKPNCIDCGKTLSWYWAERCKSCEGLNRIKNGTHNAWKGNKVGYYALHAWVRKWLGKAQKCEHCGKEKTTPKSIHWANKSHKYLRELTDWISLCARCHAQYDGNRGRRSLI